jgi:transcriptional regulator with XRE-family HTH domain
MDFARSLRSARRATGFTQAQVAEWVGVHPSYISKLETGCRTPSSRATVMRIASALQLDLTHRNALLLSAGYAPVVIEQLVPSDPSLRLMADILTDPRVPQEELSLLRDYLSLVDRRRRERRVESHHRS